MDTQQSKTGDRHFDAMASLAKDARVLAEDAIKQRDELRAENARLKQDCMTLVLRLGAESDDSHAPETLEVLQRWHPALLAMLSGDHTRESAAALAGSRA